MYGIFQKALEAYLLDINRNFKNTCLIFKHIMGNIDFENAHIYDIGITLFSMAEHVRLSKDMGLLEYTSFIEEAVNILLKDWGKPYPTIFGKYEMEVNSSNLGIIYGGLASINRYLKREDVSISIREIKEYVFKNNISGGMLVSNRTMEISPDIIFSAVPFGMFSPEDLVFVEALKKLEKMPFEDDLPFLLLSWCYAERGNYVKAIDFLKRIGSYSQPLLKTIRGIVLKTLVNAEKSEGRIVHRPYGNENRYVHENFERLPHDPKEGESVVIKAMAWPYKPNILPYLHYTVNGIRADDIVGKFVKDENGEYYEWEIGPFKKFDTVDYYIYMNDLSLKSENYSFNVWGVRSAVSVEKVISENGYIKILARDEDGKICPDITIKLESGYIDVGFNRPGATNHYNTDISIKDNDTVIHVREDNMNIEILKNPFSLKLYTSHGIILETTRKNWLLWYEDDRGVIKEIDCSFIAKDNEKFYGFGERYNSINQRGNMPDVYVYNQYKNQGIRTYIPIPYFMSSKGYGMYINTPYYVKFDMACTRSDIFSFSVEDNNLTLYIMAGKPKDILKKFTDIVEKPSMLPKWAFGPWMSSNNWDNKAEVLRQVELTKKYDIPATVLVIEAWSDEATYYIFNDAVYDENDGSRGFRYDDFKFPEWGRWPDPKGMLEYLHQNGLKCILWQIPIIKNIRGIPHLQNDVDEEYAISHGYCAKNPDGTPYRIPEGWFKDSLILDFTNPEAVNWWFEKRRYLVEDIGVDGFKTDGGEFVFGRDVRFYDGRTGREMRNLYPNEYVGAYYRFINQLNPNGGITFSRAGYTGAQKFPAHWAGDENSTFGAFKSSIIAGLTAGMSGISFWGWDLAGFSGDIPSAELYIRAAQMAAFCPIMQYHAESRGEFNQDRTPWNIAQRTGEKRALDYFRYYARIRMNLLPYIYNEALKSVKNGLPLMRALIIEYPEDEKCADIEDQYMFGDNILVAPVVKENVTGRTVFLPYGKWVDFWNDTVFEGGVEIYIDAPLKKIPVFVKYNSIIPMNLNDEFKVGGSISNRLDSYEHLCFRVYGNYVKDYKFVDDFGNEVLINVDNDDICVEINRYIPLYIICKKNNVNIKLNGRKVNPNISLFINETYVYFLK